MEQRTRFLAKTDASGASIYIYDDIGKSMWGDGVSAKDVIEALKQVAGSKSLCIYINSMGGDVFEGMSMYNAISRFMGDVTVCVDGLAASAASIVAMAGEKIVMGPGSMMMIHDPSSIAFGNSEEMKTTADRLDKIRDAMLETYVARTGQPRETVKAMMAAETWMTATECVSLGFADSVLSRKSIDAGTPADMKAAASLSPLIEKFRNVPQGLLTKYAAQAKRVPQHLAPPRNARPAASAARHTASRAAGSGTKEPVIMAKQEKAASAALETLKQVHAEATSSLRETIATHQATIDDLREKHDNVRAELAAEQVKSKAKDDQIASLRAELAETCAVAGKQSVAEARGVFAAWKAETEAHKELRAKVSKMESDHKRKEFNALLDKGVAEGKVTPAEKEKFAATADAQIETATSFLETVLLARQPVIKVNGTGTEQPKPAETSAVPANIPADVVEMAKTLGWDPAKLAAQIARGETPAVS